MFLDGYDLYVDTNVLPAALQSGFSTPALNADFISKTFLGMTIGALITGFIGAAMGGASPTGSISRCSGSPRWRPHLHPT